MLEVSLLDYQFKNPIVPASGTFGYGYEMARFYDVATLGSIALKAVTGEKRFGNPLSRVCDTPGGMLNAIGLQNPGVDEFVSEHLPKITNLVDYPLFFNVSGSTVLEYVEVVKKICEASDIGIIELNVSCPNVKLGAMAFGSDPLVLAELVREVKAVSSLPVFVKLTPNVTDISAMAVVCEKSGADGLVLINTLVGMRIDVHKKAFMLANKTGGLSGGAVFPVALKMVYDVSRAVNIPIVGCGGVSCASEVVEMMMAGASLVQVGTQNLIDPYACPKIIAELESLVKDLGYDTVSDVIGVMHE